MTLLTADGKPYRTFSEPNPILKTQEAISKKDLVLHNFQWEAKVESGPPPIKAPEKKKKKPKFENESQLKSQAPQQNDDFLELLRKEASELRNEVPKPHQKPQPEAAKPNDPFDSAATLIVHCLPAVIREKTDSFYGESRKTIQYGEKFQIEALELDCNDIAISLFAKQALEKGTIVYPSAYKNSNDKLDYCRWWRITRSAAANGGFVNFGEITDYQGSF